MTNRTHATCPCAWLICLMGISSPCINANLGDVKCDPGLQPAGGNEVGYALRGERCEGLYVQEVSGGTLEVVSFTENFKAYKSSNDKPLLLEWPALGDTQVQVRACSLRRKLYYRMDTLRAQKPPSYLWPSDILSRLELRRDEIGLLAWTEQPLATGRRTIHLPVRVTPQESPASAQQNAVESYRVVLLSNVELQEVYITLCPLDSNGRPGKPIRKSSKLDYGFYPADRPITLHISFSELNGAPDGLYSLSVGAELKNGNPKNAAEVCFFHPRGTPRRQVDGGKP